MEKFSAIEVVAVILALLYLALAAYRNIWCWLAAAVSSLLYIKICYDSQLYIETGLQFFYFVMAIIGYWQWKKNTKENEMPITQLSIHQLISGVVICGIVSLLMASWFQQYTAAAMPWFDAPITVFSVWATWLVIKKKIQNWVFWIVIDGLAAYVYMKRSLHLTALLYLLYTGLALIGYIKWKKDYHASSK